MNAQERAAYVRSVMEERMAQGFGYLEAHSFAVTELERMEAAQAEWNALHATPESQAYLAEREREVW